VPGDPLGARDAGGADVVVSTCAMCSNAAVATVNGVPVCADHLAELQRQATAREDSAYAAEAARQGIELPPAVLRDHEFGPVCWLLSAPYIARKAWRFVHVDRRAVDWAELLEAAAPWSHYENLMVRIAFNLWGGQGGGPDGWAAGAFDLSELAGLDRHNWQRVVEAVALARGKRLVIFDPPAAKENS
jgi:hypothetical protein